MMPPSEEEGVEISTLVLAIIRPFTRRLSAVEPPLTCSLLTLSLSKSSPPFSSDSKLAASKAISVILEANDSPILPASVVEITDFNSSVESASLETLSNSEIASLSARRKPLITTDG